MIFLDPRVGSKHLAPIFEEMKVPFEVTPLSFGDCAFLGNGPEGPVRVGIEIKGGRGGSDFLASMQSGRLVGHQIEGLVENYDRRYLIVEGLRATKNGCIWTPPRRGGGLRPIFMLDVKKYLTGIEEAGIRVRHTATPEATARVIWKELFAFWSKDYDSHSSISANVLYQPPVFSLTKEDENTARVRRVLVALKAGVGVGRSKEVAKRFGSVHALVTAAPEAWEGIEGVGKKIARDVVEAIHAGSPSDFQAVSAKRVSPRHGAVDRSARRARQRQNNKLDSGRRVERRVHKARTRRRVPNRH